MVQPSPLGLGGYKLSNAQIYETVKAAGFKGNDAVTMTAIVLAESGGISNNSLFTPGSGASVGLAQVTAQSSGGYSIQALTNPLTNLQQAYTLYSGRGFEPWTTYNTGAYKSKLSDAMQGALQAQLYPIDPVNSTDATGIVGSSSGVSYSFPNALKQALSLGDKGFGDKGPTNQVSNAGNVLGLLGTGSNQGNQATGPGGVPLANGNTNTEPGTSTPGTYGTTGALGKLSTDIRNDLIIGSVIVGGAIAIILGVVMISKGKGKGLPEVAWVLIFGGTVVLWSAVTGRSPLCVLKAGLTGDKTESCNKTLSGGGVLAGVLEALVGTSVLSKVFGGTTGGGGNSGGEGEGASPDPEPTPEPEPSPAPEVGGDFAGSF